MMAGQRGDAPREEMLVAVLKGCSHTASKTPQDIHDHLRYSYSSVQSTLKYAANAGLLTACHLNPGGWVPSSVVRYRLTVAGEEYIRDQRYGGGGR